MMPYDPRAGPGGWRSGPPPEVGWWPASTCKDPGFVRWWNGRWWSIGISSYCSAEKAGISANVKSIYSSNVLWTDRWWESENAS